MPGRGAYSCTGPMHLSYPPVLASAAPAREIRMPSRSHGRNLRSTVPLTPADIHNVEFAKASLGKRGYDEEQVDALLDEITQEMIKLLEENDVLQRRTEQASASSAVDDLAAELASARRECDRAEQHAL